MKIEGINKTDPNIITPKLLVHQLVELIETEKTDFLIVIRGNKTEAGIVPSISHSTMSLPELLYFRHSLDLLIRSRSDETLKHWLGEQ